MKFEIRPDVKEEMEDFRHVAFTALVLSPEVMPPEIVHGINPDWTLCAISAIEAARMGRLDVRDAGALCTWDRLMRTKYRPFCADFF